MAAKGGAKKRTKGRKIEIDRETADLLRARADALGISVAELMAAIAGNKPAAPPMSANGDAPAAAAPAERAPPEARWRDVKAWIDSWGKPDERPRPKLGK